MYSLEPKAKLGGGRRDAHTEAGTQESGWAEGPERARAAQPEHRASQSLGARNPLGSVLPLGLAVFEPQLNQPESSFPQVKLLPFSLMET